MAYKITRSNSLMLILLLMATGSVAYGVSQVVRQLDAGLMISLMLMGVLSSWFFARLTISAKWGIPILILLGVVLVFGRVGQLFYGFFYLVTIIIRFTWNSLHNFEDGLPDFTPLWSAVAIFFQQLIFLLNRLTTWWSALFNQNQSFDPVAITLTWGLVVWLVAIWSAWWVRRKAHPLLGVTPAGVLLLVTFAYTRPELSSLQVLLGSTMLLMGLTHYRARKTYWEVSNLDFSGEIRLDFFVIIVPLVLLLTMFASIIPSLSIRQIATYTQELVWGNELNNQFATSLGFQQSTKPKTFFETVQWGGLPRSHLLGSGPELSESVVFVATIEGEESLTSIDDTFRPYWRGLTYDEYTGRGWRTRNNYQVHYATYDPSEINTLPQQKVVRQHVQQFGTHNNLLYVMGDLLTVNQPYQISWRDNRDIFATSTSARRYEADSQLPMVSENQLRSTSTDYPAEIYSYYLQIPDTLPNRVRTLANDLTANAPTPYDRALAIESYLRKFPYTLDISEPPKDIDIVDYFLFDLQEGYCDYYASSMVVLARSVGLPARLAMGYASGSYDDTTQRYIVTEADAHSWVEIYFPEHGWVTFEPTGGRPNISRPSEGMLLPVLPQLPDVKPPKPIFYRWLGWGLASGLLILAGCYIILIMIDNWFLRRLSPSEALIVIYQRVYYYGGALSTDIPIGSTPYEFSHSFTQQLPNQLPKQLASFLQPILIQIPNLTNYYVQVVYGADLLTEADKSTILHNWRMVRFRLWFIWLYRYMLNKQQSIHFFNKNN
ncbi:transglutaminaseTgpA domain-containing protein [Anaerolineales bacterium HSG6]|nr:transglutaminaseTgpA domain-containing protein [Anaerolineales bacterium HSG6]